MSWNGSNGASAPKQKPTNGARAVSKGAIAGVIVVLGAAAALYFLMPASAPTPKASAPKEKSTAIEEVKPEIVEKTVEDHKSQGSTEVDPKDLHVTPDMSPEEKRAIVEKKLGGRFVKRDPVERLFTSRANNQICRLMAVKPGGLILGTVDYKKSHFAERFQESLSEEIVVSPDDPDEVRLMKETVLDIREELKAALARGDDIEEIMNETEAELHNLQRYRMELKDQMAKIQRNDPTMTEHDLEDLTAAVNEMLSRRGAEPLKNPKLMAIRLHKLAQEEN